MHRRFWMAIALGAGIGACGYRADTVAPVRAPGDGDTASVVVEAFMSAGTRPDNLDTPALWHGPDGDRLLVTAKSSHRLAVYDAATGRTLGSIGGPGSGPGRFRRPNGIVVLGDLAFVVERDNRRVQVLRLPEGRPVGSFGEGALRSPYGLATVARGPGEWDVYVTDAYTLLFGRIPPARRLGERVKRFRVRVAGDSLRAELLGSFGDTFGPGVLRQVESIHADPAHGRLLIADEASIDVKVYTMEGQYAGRTLGSGYLYFEPEGIALYDCGAGDGYWIVTDQSLAVSYFHVLDRRSMEHRGVFRGAVVANTDGVVLTQRQIGGWEGGAFYPVHDDRGVAALRWSDVAAALGLRSCSAPGA
jgi:3-phytase